MNRLAIVVQRYGAEITGGAELHARWVAERLRDRMEITVFTTTALDYLTWENHYPEGDHEVNGIRVVRFPVEEQRDLDHFNLYSRWIFNEQHRDVDEQRWLRMQGPFAPKLVEALPREKRRFDCFFFFTYLYYTTVKGLEEVSDKAVMLPTTHDEPPLRLRMYQKVFDAPRGFLLNTEPERRLIDQRFGLGHRPVSVVGMGVDLPASVDTQPVLERFGLRQPYALTFGRITRGKRHDLVLDRYPADKTDLDLVIFGKAELEIPENPKIRYLGRVGEDERWALIAGAAFTIHPSPYESLSLALLESLAMGAPVLVNGDCVVLQEHVDICDGGISYSGESGFGPRFLELAAMSEAERKRMGEAGREYVMKHYDAGAVTIKYAEFLEIMMDQFRR